jgi:hypothetical protein
MVTNAKTATTTMVLMAPFVAPEYGEIPGGITQKSRWCVFARKASDGGQRGITAWSDVDTP